VSWNHLYAIIQVQRKIADGESSLNYPVLQLQLTDTGRQVLFHFQYNYEVILPVPIRVNSCSEKGVSLRGSISRWRIEGVSFAPRTILFFPATEYRLPAHRSLPTAHLLLHPWKSDFNKREPRSYSYSWIAQWRKSITH